MLVRHGGQRGAARLSPHTVYNHKFQCIDLGFSDAGASLRLKDGSVDGLHDTRILM